MENMTRIFCSDRTSAVMEFAGRELNTYLSRILPPSVLSEKAFRLQLVDSGFRYDGFSVTERADEICIASCQERGILHGVYALLRQMGCSFLFPGLRRERIPHLAQWPHIEEIHEEPWIEYRGICLYNTTKETLQKTLDAIDWMAKNGFNFLLTSIHRLDDTGCSRHGILWSEIGDELLPELQKRGIVIDMSEHSTDFYFPRDELFEQHPEWFSLLNGVRTKGQICYSNPDAVNAYGDAIAAFAKDKPWFQFLGIWPLDGGGYCECEHCRDSQTIFRANSVIAEKIRAVRPDLTVEHLAYTPQSFPRPKTPMPDNMSVLVCHQRNEIAYEWADAARSAGGAFYFDYMTGDHYRYRSNVILNPAYCQETVNTLISYGYRGVVSLYLPVDCWFQSSLNYWYLSHLYYHPMASLQELHRSLAALLFGPDLAEPGADILEEICSGLLNPTLFNGNSFAPGWYCQHLLHRSRALDELHAENFDAHASSVSQKMKQLSDRVPEENRVFFDRLSQWLQLQSLYYHCVDQFNAETDTESRAEPYFAYLKELEGTPDSPFISEEYARWRVVGRDNIFNTAHENLFQART